MLSTSEAVSLNATVWLALDQSIAGVSEGASVSTPATFASARFMEKPMLAPGSSTYPAKLASTAVPVPLSQRRPAPPCSVVSTRARSTPSNSAASAALPVFSVTTRLVPPTVSWLTAVVVPSPATVTAWFCVLSTNTSPVTLSTPATSICAVPVRRVSPAIRLT